MEIIRSKEFPILCLIILMMFALTVYENRKFLVINTVDWYSQHKSERSEMIKWCNNSADRANETNCKNALLALGSHENLYRDLKNNDSK